MQLLGFRSIETVLLKIGWCSIWYFNYVNHNSVTILFDNRQNIFNERFILQYVHRLVGWLKRKKFLCNVLTFRESNTSEQFYIKTTSRDLRLRLNLPKSKSLDFGYKDTPILNIPVILSLRILILAENRFPSNCFCFVFQQCRFKCLCWF